MSLQSCMTRQIVYRQLQKQQSHVVGVLLKVKTLLTCFCEITWRITVMISNVLIESVFVRERYFAIFASKRFFTSMNPFMCYENMFGWKTWKQCAACKARYIYIGSHIIYANRTYFSSKYHKHKDFRQCARCFVAFKRQRKGILVCLFA